ncbi:MAG: winged helix-turn-helix domain-containing protein [Actinomycetota bacterium]
MKVADYTSRRKSTINLTISYHSAADLLNALWIVSDRCIGNEITDLDLGADWFDDLAEGLSQETMATIEKLGCGDLWLALVTLLPETSEGGSVADFISFLTTYEPADLRMRLLQYYDSFEDEHRELMADVAEGNSAEIDNLLSMSSMTKAEAKPWKDALRFLLEMSPEETRAFIVGALSAFQSEVFEEHERAFRSNLEADYQAKKKMARRLSPGRVIEIATNGIALADDHTRLPIVLVPNMITRPWVVMTMSSDVFIVNYPVSDDCIDADPDAPPSWLVKLHKALGDERRLRILRTLSQGDASLAELSKDADIAKSTLHHHLMLLRAAGLIRVEVGEDKRYSLRGDSLPEAAAYLDHYIHGTTDSSREES